ncbi:MAG: hypothetical protein JST14_15375 [Bacteroidetes bacterium]|nr:hypothetical protein [Bacteroidota bacterium]MBS1977123.1 hypothetical protein [Bacteroidota bacterium]
MIDERRHIQAPLVYLLPWAELCFEVLLVVGFALKVFNLYNAGESLVLLSADGLAITFFLMAFTSGKGLQFNSVQKPTFGDRLTIILRRIIYLGISASIAGISLHFLRKVQAVWFLIGGLALLILALGAGAALNREHPERLRYLRGSMIRGILFLVIAGIYAVS